MAKNKRLACVTGPRVKNPGCCKAEFLVPKLCLGTRKNEKEPTFFAPSPYREEGVDTGMNISDGFAKPVCHQEQEKNQNLTEKEWRKY